MTVERPVSSKPLQREDERRGGLCVRTDARSLVCPETLGTVPDRNAIPASVEFWELSR